MTRSLSICLLAIVSTTMLSACGNRDKPVYPVQGQIRINNAPAAGALVILTPLQDAEPEKWPKGYPRGTAQEDGSFKITTNQTDDGAPAGDYVVTVLWMFPVEGERESRYDRLQGRYANPASSKIRVEIKPERQGNQLAPIELAL